MKSADYNNMNFDQIVEGIKDLSIQGATNIALAAVHAFELKLQENASHEELIKSVKTLESARATEPGLRNALKYCLANYKNEEKITEKIKNHFKEGKVKIAEIGSKKIQDGMTIYTHCHSSTAESIIIEAHKQGKNIQVINTETRPRYQGRITALKISEAGIPIKHYVDSAGHLAIKQADICLFGADSINVDGRVINKIGTKNMIDIAASHGIPVYICTNSWKLNPDTINGIEEIVEQRSRDEIWAEAPKEIEIINPAFDTTSPDKITGVITEIGVVKPEALLTLVQKEYPWMF